MPGTYALALQSLVPGHLILAVVPQRQKAICPSCWHRDATLDLFKARLREDKNKADVLVAGVLQADPRVRRNEDSRSRVNIAFLTSKPHVSRTGLDQDDLVLSEVFVPRDLPTGRNALRSENQMTGPTVFWVHFDRELRSRHCCLARTSDAVFAIALFENERLCFHVCRGPFRRLDARNAVASKKRHKGTQYERTPSHTLLSPLFLIC